MHHPKRRFGQHFLRDTIVVEKIVAAINPQAADLMLEIGPGQGALTRSLLPYLNELTVVEIDREVIPELEKNCCGIGELKIIQQDILRFELRADNMRIVGNLPYNISTPLIFKLLSQIQYIKDMHFMLQKEVAERLVAEVGTKKYGRLGVMTQYFCEVELLFLVSASAFYPAPKVESAVVRLMPRDPSVLHAIDIANLRKVVKYAFMQRRKTIRNSLKGIVNEETFIRLEINPGLRAEQLTVADFVTLCNGIN